ncbi:MAG: 50S ribosomal protein L24 [Oscillospiraceae bacterium]|jgi:large subunit ribosomal protein L24|nr:50S ribosomal protein L24 [Oscillospiraceae bacterium]
MKKKVHVKTGDTVIVLSGKYRGKVGKVVAVSLSENKVIVEKTNIVSKHVKPKKAGQEGGILQAEAAMYASKVQLVCSTCNESTRVSHVLDDKGKKRRACKKCSAVF